MGNEAACALGVKDSKEHGQIGKREHVDDFEEFSFNNYIRHERV